MCTMTGSTKSDATGWTVTNFLSGLWGQSAPRTKTKRLGTEKRTLWARPMEQSIFSLMQWSPCACLYVRKVSMFMKIGVQAYLLHALRQSCCIVAGEVMVHDQMMGDSLYVIMSGKCVKKCFDKPDEIFSRGACFGEEQLMYSSKHSFEVVCLLRPTLSLCTFGVF